MKTKNIIMNKQLSKKNQKKKNNKYKKKQNHQNIKLKKHMINFLLLLIYQIMINSILNP